ncbi:YaiI/YqxD family protein [Neobacillus terrae]|uniref:YaiI/YqxD family protein n=1 Tax=Neobacillus terrae TaxID=3034837 RepID=UPI003B75CED6
MPTIFVDADSCPVKEEIVEIASDFSIKVLFVASYNHVKNDFTYAEWKYVDIGKEAADLFIMNHAAKGDIAVTQDIGLASTLLPKGVYVLSPRGTLFEEKGILTALDLRFLSAKARRRGEYGKGPKPFISSDRERFVKELTNILSNLVEG